MRGFLLYLPVTCLCAKLESCLWKIQPLSDALLCTFCERGQGEKRREEPHVPGRQVALLRLSSAPSPRALTSLVYHQWPNSHCRDSHIQFPDLVGCILLCKHSPLGLWNPKQHIYLHLNGERENSPETSPRVASVICFWLLETGRGGVGTE